MGVICNPNANTGKSCVVPVYTFKDSSSSCCCGMQHEAKRSNWGDFGLLGPLEVIGNVNVLLPFVETVCDMYLYLFLDIASYL